LRHLEEQDTASTPEQESPHTSTNTTSATRATRPRSTTPTDRITSPPPTTSRKKQKRDGGDVRIGLGKRVKVRRADLFHTLSGEQRDHIPQDIGNSYPLFGTVIGGGGTKTAKKGWDVSFDIFPAGMKEVSNISRNKLTVLAPGDDETADHHLNQVEELENIRNAAVEEKKKSSPMNQKKFAALDDK
jgi:hypothetical protein